MTTATRPATTECWTPRRYGEPVPEWAGRMARAYAAAHPGALARLDAAEQADTRAHLFCAVNDLGGQDPYPRYGRADYGNGTDSWDSTETDADDG
jgi:hypothetical protein